MPFVGKNIKTGERIDITKLEHPKEEINFGDIVCPLCGSEFRIVDGFIRVAHFRHNTKCNSSIKHHPESIEHEAAKNFIVDMLRKGNGKYRAAQVELEVVLPEIDRRADILVSSNGWKEAIEIQLSSITTKELSERTLDYAKLGISTVWIFGKDRPSFTEENKNWCIEQFGDFVFIEFSYNDNETILFE